MADHIQRIQKVNAGYQLAGRLGGRFVFACLILSAILSALVWVPDGAARLRHLPATISDPISEDLAAFYRAGQMAAEGRGVEAYDVEAFRAPLTGHAETLVFRYPPHFLLMAEPLAWMTYGQAKAVFLLISLGALIAIPIILGAPAVMGFFIVASGIGFHTLNILNNSVLAILLIVLGLVLSERRPWLAGFLLGLATVKPQYGLMVPVFLLASGHYRTIVSACVTTAGLLAASALLYGGEVFGAYLGTFSEEIYVSYLNAATLGFFNVTSMLGKLGLPLMARDGIYILIIAISTGIVWVAARRCEAWQALGLCFLASACAAPAFMAYSWPLLAAAHCAFLKEREPWPAGVQVVLGLLWLQPMATSIITAMLPTDGMKLAYSIVPSVNILLALLVCTAWLWCREADAAEQSVRPR
ncbi:DUF2029 domain-containing protein [Roseibium sp. CAU 1637]|uniref:DUF2029 domain-containing protein n=1 Tax=Roseibium limicola TaxID=2816037 RepID=A0A939EMX8_9HYPH|nr:glycosyltransferase family 87 protein [Roseibium limicola]MBO0345105.1 DUF2029 domain-containing protein [Roseibium limicola]